MAYEHGGNIHQLIRESGKAAQEILDFSANINPLGLSELGKTRMLKSLEGLTHYPDPHYIMLKEKLSAYYSVEDSQISVFNGAAEGLHELIRYLNPQRAMVLAPSFVEYEKALKAIQCEIEWFDLKALEQFQINEKRFLVTIELERPDLIVLCTPNNPTGKLLSMDFVEKVAELSRRWQGNILIDEAFFDFLPEGSKSMALLAPFYPHLFVMKSFTKFFGVPGLRLGAILSSNQGFREYMDTYGVPWRINAMAEQYALGAIEDRDYQKNTRQVILEERFWMMENLCQMENLTVYESFADYLLIKISEDLADFVETSLRRDGIMIRNCSNYRGLGKGYFRIAVKSHDSNERLLEAMSKVLK